VQTRVNVILTDAERRDLNAWTRTRDAEDIDSVAVDAGSVTVRGSDPQTRLTSATAVRDTGRLIGALNEALAVLHNLP
jgi:hypothetical protein